MWLGRARGRGRAERERVMERRAVWSKAGVKYEAQGPDIDRFHCPHGECVDDVKFV